MQTPSRSSWTRVLTKAFAVTVALASWSVAAGGCSTPVTNETMEQFAAPICASGSTLCGDECVDVSTDRDNCGACGKGCAGTCSQGVCSLTCLGGFAACDGACVDLQNDRANCGECGKACGAGKVCSLGKCEVGCPVGTLLCGGACANLASDAENCGGCGKVCAGAPNGAPKCAASKCGLKCDEDYSECSGACVDTKSDLANCGECGTTCAMGEECLAGKCKTPNVLILGAANTNWNAEVRAKLDGTAAFTAVDLYPVGSQTPTLADLQGYYAVLVYADYNFADGTALGNVLASYWDGGGKVVISHFANAYGYLGGAFADLAQGYMLFDPNGDGFSDPCSGQITFDEPASPLVKDVVSLTAGSAYRSNAAPVNGGIVVARWSDGTPLVVRGTKNGRDLVELNFYPPSVDSREDFWAGSGTELMRNALLF